MKHLFMINPMSGKGKGKDFILPIINDVASKRNLDYEVYISKSQQDAQDYARAQAQKGEPIRIYACGGDGTIYDVVNAIYGYDNAEFAAVPLGSGNDFIRLFGTKDNFINIDAQIDGTVIPIDAIKCGDRIAVNQCSMGMDAETCAKQADFKKIAIFSGESAYTAALLYCALKKRKNRFTVTIDDGEPVTNDFVFAFCGNSRYYGGGYMAGPYALPDDGMLDFGMVKTMPLLKLLSRISDYKNGKHYTWDETTYLRGKKMTVHCDELAAVNIDGECEMAHERTFELIENAFKFVVPKTSTYFEDKKSGKINNKIGG